MKIPLKVNIRLVFKFSHEETFTKFYWFKMDNDELYWGSPGKSKIEHYSITPSDGKITIAVPENLMNILRLIPKFHIIKVDKYTLKKNLKINQLFMMNTVNGY